MKTITEVQLKELQLKAKVSIDFAHKKCEEYEEAKLAAIHAETIYKFALVKNILRFQTNQFLFLTKENLDKLN